MPPTPDEDLGNGGDDKSAGGRDREMARAINRVASTGYVRGNPFVVVRGGAVAKLADEPHAEHAHLHDHHQDAEELLAADGSVAEALSEIRASVLSASGAEAANPVGAAMATIEAQLSVEVSEKDVYARRAAEARMKGYEGDACGTCGNFTLVRNGTCMKCNTCGSTSGCS